MLSFHCLPLPSGKRPWLQLFTLPPRIWVLKKSVGREGWQSILMVAVGNLVDLSRQKLPTLSRFEIEFLREECCTISAISKILKTFIQKEIQQLNGAQIFDG